MKHKKDITPRNNKGQVHGYQEWYNYHGERLWTRGVYKNNRPMGYREMHSNLKTIFYLT